MKNYLVSLFIMIVFVIIGAGVANACVIEKATDVDIGAIELAKSQGVEAYVVAVPSYDYLLTSEINTMELVKELTLDRLVYDYSFTPYIDKPFYLSLYNDDHRSDWLNKESLKITFDIDRQNQNTSYRRLRRVQHRSSIQGQSS